MNTRKLISHCFLFVSAMLFLLALPQNVFSQASKLKVIPEVQAFTLGTGNYTVPATVQILVNTAKNDSLVAVANQLKDELLTMFNVNATVTSTTSTAAAGADQILLTYSQTALKNKEAYNLELNTSSGVTITGASRIGAFWGTRTLLQLIENHKNKIPSGKIVDYPNFPSRGFMLDVGRKFFTIDFLRHYVKLMSYYKMNEFHVHLNDNAFKQYYGNDWNKTYAAFRLESTTYPGLTATDGSYTKEEFRNLQLLGMQYGVNVIPEIDIPAHALAFTRFKPELKASAPYAADHLDILNDAKLPIIYDFFDKLFDEYIKGDNPAFVGPDVHIGTDEFVKEGNIRSVDNAQAKRFREFTNHYLKYIADLGKTPRLWGGLEWLKDSPLTPVPPVGNAVMNAWSRDWVNPSQMLADGFKLITTRDDVLYIVPSAGYYRDFLDTQWLYNSFRPENVNGSQTLANFQKGLIGATFAVWNDICGNGTSQQDVHFRAFPALKVMATKNWKVAPTLTYTAYAALADSTSEGAGLNLIGRYTKAQLSAIMNKIGAAPLAFDGKTEIALGGTDFGYNYDVSFDLKPAAANAANSILFQSAYSKVTLNTNNSGKLGFSRDGYVYTFNYTPKTDAWQNIRIVGDYRSVTLYVDGTKIERLAAYRKSSGIPSGFNMQQTLFFPLEKAGDAVNGFKGEMKNLMLEPLDLEKIKAAFLATKTTVKDGLYYIKQGENYLTNTPAKGSAPTFQAKSATLNTQQFKITLDKAVSRYKIVSAADETKYVNELGVFGSNPYYATWNTYNFYMQNDLYAIQNDGDAGKGFWYISGNRFQKGDEVYEDSNYLVQLIPVDGTGVERLSEKDVHISVNNLILKISGVDVKTFSLINIDGKLISTNKNRNEITLKPEWKGAFLVQLTDKESKTGVFKVIL